MAKTFPLNNSELKELVKKIPTPFYLYDEKAIRENMREFTKAFSIFPSFREHYAVKACPNPYILKILASEGCGADCSSEPELLLSEMSGIKGEKVIFTSNETPASEYLCAYKQGNIINLDDIKDKPDFIILDPPRDGINPKALNKIIDYGVSNMVYISCKPTSLARDLEVLLERGYKLVKACTVDMFPNTAHVETVVQLVNIGVKPDYTVRLELDVDEFYKTVGEEKRHFVKPD